MNLSVTWSNLWRSYSVFWNTFWYFLKRVSRSIKNLICPFSWEALQISPWKWILSREYSEHLVGECYNFFGILCNFKKVSASMELLRFLQLFEFLLLLLKIYRPSTFIFLVFIFGFWNFLGSLGCVKDLSKLSNFWVSGIVHTRASYEPRNWLVTRQLNRYLNQSSSLMVSLASFNLSNCPWPCFRLLLTLALVLLAATYTQSVQKPAKSAPRTFASLLLKRHSIDYFQIFRS